MKPIRSLLFILLTTLLFSNCGGGGGGGDTSPSSIPTSGTLYSHVVQFGAIGHEESEPASGGNTITIPLIIDNTSDQDLTIDYIISGNVVEGENYTALEEYRHIFTSASISDDTSDNLTLEILNDGKFSNAKELVINLKPTGNLGVGLQSIYTIKINNTDPPPEVSFSIEPSFDESDSDGNTFGMINFNLNTISEVDAKITVSASNISATEGIDFGISNKTLTIEAGTTQGSLPIEFVKDNIHEINEEFTLEISEVENATNVSSRETVTIVDKTGPPTALFKSSVETSKTEGDGSATVEIEVILTHESDLSPTVSFDVDINSTADQTRDYILPSPLTFTPGVKSLKAVLSIQDDIIDEDDEFIDLMLLCDVNCSQDIANHKHTIIDDDDPPTLNFASSGSIAGESSSDITHDIKVTLSNESEKIINFTYKVSSGGNAIADSDYVADSTPIIINPRDTSTDIEITIKADSIDVIETKTLILEFDSFSNVSIGNVNSHTVSIQDYQSSNPTVSFDQATNTVLESAGTVKAKIELDNRTLNSFTLPYTVSGSAIFDTHYTNLTDGSVSFSAGEYSKEISFDVIRDNIYDEEKEVIITLGSVTGVNIGTNSSKTISIQNVDPPPTVSFTTTTGNLGEGDDGDSTTYSFTLSLSTTNVVDVLVPMSISGTAVSGSDFSGLGSSAITIPAGSLSAETTFNILGNNVNTPDKTLILTIVNPTNASIGNNNIHTITINDNDSTYQINWDKNRERTVNSLGGGYKIYYSKVDGFNMMDALGTVDVPFVTGETPNSKSIDLPTDTYFFKVMAYSSYKPTGGEVSDQVSH